VSERVGEFFTARGFYFRGRLINETPTHYVVFDLKTEREVELLKTVVERVVWEAV